MAKITLTRGTRVRLDCEQSILRLAKCRKVALSLNREQSQSHCDLTAWKLHRASRLSVDINKAVAQLDAVLNYAGRKVVITAEDASTEAEEEEPPHWLVAMGYKTVSKAGDGVMYVADIAKGPAVATVYAAAAGAQQSAITTYNLARPKVVAAVQYVVSPSGALNVGATACAFTSFQLATLATTCSTASVTANGLAAVLTTSAEVVVATGSTGAIRQALRDPQYAKKLQELLNKRREAKQRRRFLDTFTTWASLVNSGVSMVPGLNTVSRVVAGTGSRLSSLVFAPDPDADGDPAAVGAAVVGKKSYLLESTRLALFVNSWVSTSLHGKVHALRDTPENSVQFLVSVAGQAAEYRQLGWVDGSRQAYGDLISPALFAATGAGFSLGRQAVGGAFYCTLHPFATISSVYSIIRPGPESAES